MYGPTLSTDIITAIFLRFEELLRKAGKMDMFETLVYNYRLKENLPFQCLQRFASLLNDLIRQLTELSVALEAGTHMSQPLHKTDYECGPDCEAVVNRFCLMESLLESNDLADFGMNCTETEICETADGDDATVDLIGETVAILGESDILLPRQNQGMTSPSRNDKQGYTGHEILMPISNTDSTVTISCNVVEGILELSSNVCNDLPVGIQPVECNRHFLTDGNLVPNQTSMIPETPSDFIVENGNFHQSQLDSVIECDETFIAVADEVLKMRQETFERNSPVVDTNVKVVPTKNTEPPQKRSGTNITFLHPKPVQCKKCGKTFLTEKGLKSHEGLTHKRSPEAIAKQRKEEELILQKIGVLTGVTSPNINQSASFQEITAAATNNLNKTIANSQKRALDSQNEAKTKQLSKVVTTKCVTFKSSDLVQCHQCGKTFMTVKGLKSHEGLVHKKVAGNGKNQETNSVNVPVEKVVQMPSQCKICGKTFMTEKGLKSHEGLVHKRAQDKNKLMLIKDVTDLIKKPNPITNLGKAKKESGESQNEDSNESRSTNSNPGKPNPEKVGSPLKTAIGSLTEVSINLSKASKLHNSYKQKKADSNTLNLQYVQTEKKKVITDSQNSSKEGQLKAVVLSSLEEDQTKIKESDSKCTKLDNSPIPNEKSKDSLEPMSLRKGLRKRDKPIEGTVFGVKSKPIFLAESSEQGKVKGESETSSDFTVEELAEDAAQRWIVCEKCVLVFKTVNDFRRHNCAFLGDKFDLPDSHSMTYIQNKAKLDSLHKFVCSICSEEFRSYQRISYHMKKCEIGPYYCEVCPPAKPPFDSMKLLNSHKRTEHREQNSYICNECGHAFKFKNSLNKHKVQVHELNGNSDTFKCDLCPEEFPKKVVLTNHKIQVHGQQRQFLCQICGSQFSSFASLTSHHAATHDSYKKFQCNYCEKRFPRKDKLLHHEATHTGEKPFCCDICGKRFVRKIRLDDHRRRHTTERRFRCTEAGCLKLFASQPDLNNHLKRHAADKEKVKMIVREGKQKCIVPILSGTYAFNRQTRKQTLKNEPPNTPKESSPITQNRMAIVRVDKFSQSFVPLQSDIIFEQENRPSDDEEHLMSLEESTTSMEYIQQSTVPIADNDKEIFQLGYSPSDVYGCNPSQPFSQSSPISYDTVDADSTNLMDIGELDSQLYASQMDIHLSLDEDSKTLNNNLNELSNMIAQELCHPNSFDSALC